MAAYTAVISLLQTIEQLQQRHPELIQGQTARTLESLHDTAEYFQNVVDGASQSKFDPEKIKSLEEKIRVAASDAEDVVEMKICEIISWTYGNAPESSLRKNFLAVVERIDTVKNEVMEIVSDFSTSSPVIDDDQILESAGDSLIDTSSRSNLMLHHLEDDVVHGLDDDLEIIVKRLKGVVSDLDIVTISGMGGIGKTTLARKAHDQLKIRFEFPWEDMSTLVMLPNLEELKLKDHAANGHVWRLSDEDKFESLKLLLFHDLTLKHWEASSDNFPNLKRLVLKKCDNLNAIPTDFGEICTLESIELHNCSTPAEDSARKIKQEQEDMGNNCLKVHIH